MAESGEEWERKMFYGEYRHSLDEKGRLTIPAEFRHILEKRNPRRLFITKGLERCLFLFTEQEWRKEEERFRNLSFTYTEARKFNRLYFSGASELSWDNQGRVLIPAYLKDYAQIQREVAIIGVSNRIEIWARDRWERFYSSSLSEFEKVAERINEIS